MVTNRAATDSAAHGELAWATHEVKNLMFSPSLAWQRPTPWQQGSSSRSSSKEVAVQGAELAGSRARTREWPHKESTRRGLGTEPHTHEGLSGALWPWLLPSLAVCFHTHPPHSPKLQTAFVQPVPHPVRISFH